MSKHGRSTRPAMGDDAARAASVMPTPDFIDAIEDGYYELDLKGRFTFINAAITAITGIRREALQSPETSHFSRFFDAETAAVLRSVFSTVYERGRSIRALEVPFLCEQGVTRLLEISISLMVDAERRPIGFRGFVRDMTERRQIEQAVRTRVQLLSLLHEVDGDLAAQREPAAVLKLGLSAALAISRADVGFIALLEDARLRIAALSGMREEDLPREIPADEGILGRALRLRHAQWVVDAPSDPDYIGSVEGMGANIVVPLISREQVLGAINLGSRDSGRFSAEVFEFVQLVAARVATALDNALLLAESRRQIAALEALVAQVTALENLKTDMIRIAAHDLRGPLSVIANYIDLLRLDLGEALSETHQGYLDSIARALDRMMHLSTDVLSLERIHERTEIGGEVVQLDAVVRRALDHQREAAALGALLVKTSFVRTACLVVGDALELGEAVSNLISNAIKYTPAGGVITVLLRQDADTVRCEVRDTGIGIPRSEQDKVFQAFYRVKTQDTLSISGTGLGLYLVKRIIERHSGTVYCKSRLGQGSRFGFVLPRVQPAAASQHACT